MLRYIARRLLLTIPLLVGISLVSFLMMHMAPGGPIGAGTDMNPKATAESRARLQAYYGLDQPLLHVVGHDMLPPARLVVDHRPVQADDVAALQRLRGGQAIGVTFGHLK